jgi:Polysaccharide lyase
MKKALLGLLILSIYGCGKVPTTLPDIPFDHFVGDFENGTISGFHYLITDTSVCTQIVTYPVRKGNFALKNTLRPDDFTNNGYRVEFSIYNCANYKNDVFYGFSFLIDSAYSDNAFNLICQWQDLPYYIQAENWEPDPNIRGSSPPLALVYVDGKLEIKMNENPQSNNQTFLVGEPQMIIKNQWYDVVAHIYWNDDETAFIEFWLNGTPITPSNGTDNKFYNRNLYNRAGNYFKFGQYRGKEKTTNTNTIYFDEVKIGSSYSEVAP